MSSCAVSDRSEVSTSHADAAPPVIRVGNGVISTTAPNMASGTTTASSAASHFQFARRVVVTG